jgi:response regulator of citrate/malate metabolism
MGCITNIDEVKSIATNASGAECFNSITKERLQSLYYAFNNKTKDLNNVAEMTQEQVDYLTTLN